MPKSKIEKKANQYHAKPTDDFLQKCVDITSRSETITAAARSIGINRVTLRRYLDLAEEKGIKSHEAPATDPAAANASEKIHVELKRGARTLDELMSATGAQVVEVLDAIDELKAQGVQVARSGATFNLQKSVQMAYLQGQEHVFRARSDGTFKFGVVGDKHIGSKYHRDDVLADLYDRFAAAEVDFIVDTGNWIDGQARFNTFDLVAHGLDAQCRLMAETHPRIPGITTYAIWGDDHEGWYAQREGIDVGSYAERIMREAGHDWVNLGFMESHLVLESHDQTQSSKMAVVHPGGGSAYATSYSVQKIVESYEGGEKPAVGLYGHYHKLEALNARNVWTLQTGCTEDQTPFMRKKRLEAHVGGAIVTLEQDAFSGAIVGFAPDMKRYFNRGFHAGRWSHHGPVNRVERTVNP